MKAEYNVKSDRYGHVHKFVQLPSGNYGFVPEKDWMPIYVTYENNGDVAFIDTDGGPCVCKGFETEEVRVVKIHNYATGAMEFELEEKNTTEE